MIIQRQNEKMLLAFQDRLINLEASEANVRDEPGSMYVVEDVERVCIAMPKFYFILLLCKSW